MSYKIKNILVPTDFSEAANNALKVAVAMAKRHHANIHLLHAIQPYLFAGVDEVHGLASFTPLPFVQIANENLEKTKQTILASNNFEVTGHTIVGSVSYSVASLLKIIEFDLIVIGTHGNTGWVEKIIGSNTLSVIKESAIPVLSIPPTFTKITFDSVLYPIRNINGVMEKYDYIKPILEKNNSSIHLLGLKLEGENASDIEIKLEKLKETILHDKDFITFQLESATSIPQKIIEVSEKRNDDLMIINATLDKAWYNFFGSSFTQYIISNSKIPVLSVKPELTPELLTAANQYMIAEANHYIPYNF